MKDGRGAMGFFLFVLLGPDLLLFFRSYDLMNHTTYDALASLTWARLCWREGISLSIFVYTPIFFIYSFPDIGLSVVDIRAPWMGMRLGWCVLV